MATYTTLKYGSSGGDVKKLQEGLINKGYDLGKSGADGVYGSSTKAAVTKYQQDMGLGVDGIAGNETLGKLYSAPSTDSTAQTDTAPKAPQTSQDWATHYEGQLGEYKPPEAAKPNDYSSPYAADIEAALDSWKNRKDFSYDFNTDPMYQQYRDQYMLGGQQAMRDTMGQAAALTGGYGNSYAQQVGKQAYDNYLSRLNEIIPTLRGQAYDMYNAEGDRLAQALSTYLALDDTAYGRHRDEVADLQRKNQEEYQRYMDELDYLQGERDYWNNKAAQEAALAAAARGGSRSGGYEYNELIPPLPEYQQYATHSFTRLDDELDRFTRIGMPNEGIDQIVDAALYGGTISAEQADILREKYKDRDLSQIIGTPILV